MSTTLRASSVRKFFETPDLWYKNHILKEDTFEGNTSTYLGSVIHKFAEAYYSLEDWSVYDILEKAPEHVDKNIILKEYKPMCAALEEKYLQQHKPDLTEHYMKKEDGNFIFQGTCDAFENGVLIDYKTSAKPKKKIDEYSQQLNIYAYLMSLTGREVHTIRVVNILRATKTISPRVNVLECKANVKEGQELTNFMIRKTKLGMNNPEFLELIFSPNNYSFLSDGFDIKTDFKEL